MCLRPKILSLLALLSVAWCSLAPAAGGDLDASFGSGGIVTTDFAKLRDQASRIAVQTDGKIVAVGTTNVTSFGSNPNLAWDFLMRLVLQPDGKIVTAGRASEGAVNNLFLVARYNGDGGLDTSFAGSGYTSFTLDGKNCEAAAVAIDSKGAILVGGQTGGIAQLMINGVSAAVDRGGGDSPPGIQRRHPSFEGLLSSTDALSAASVWGA